MQTLFPLEPLYPSGFEYYPDFISTSEETDLYKLIKKFDLRPMQFQGYEAKRKVASFGLDWSFESRKLSKGKAIPEVFNWLIERVAQKLFMEPSPLAELLLTEYPPGSLINWHRDAPPFDLIAGISLQSDCIFKLRPHQKEMQGRKSIVSLHVKRRSLYIMQGEAREQWEHSTAPVKDERFSITLRTLRDNNLYLFT